MHRVYRIFRKFWGACFLGVGGGLVDRVSVAIQCNVKYFGGGDESGAQCNSAGDSKHQTAGPGAGGSRWAGI